MAGEVTRTAALTNWEAGGDDLSRVVSGRIYNRIDTHAYTTAELQTADVLLTRIFIPSNELISELYMIHPQLDTDASPTISINVGVAAGQKFTSITSGVETEHVKDEVLSADLIVQQSTAFNSTYERAPLDINVGAGEMQKMVWELLGYDEDPNTHFRMAVTMHAGAATAAAGSVNFILRTVSD